MKNWRSGVSNFVTLVFLAGLTVAMIAIFSSQGLRSAGPGTSPIVTTVVGQVSPLSTPNASAAQIGEPVLIRIAGTTIRPASQSQNTVLIGQAGQGYTTLIELDTSQKINLANKALYAAAVSDHWMVFENRFPPSQQKANSLDKRIRYQFTGRANTGQRRFFPTRAFYFWGCGGMDRLAKLGEFSN